MNLFFYTIIAKMTLSGFIAGSLIPHLTAHIVPTLPYLAGTVGPFIAAHTAVVTVPLAGLGAVVGGGITAWKFLHKNVDVGCQTETINIKPSAAVAIPASTMLGCAVAIKFLRGKRNKTNEEFTLEKSCQTNSNETSMNENE